MGIDTGRGVTYIFASYYAKVELWPRIRTFPP